MKLKFCILISLFLFLSSFVKAGTLSQDEIKLYQLVMDYRAQHGLPSIPLSVSLTYVAQTHARDVYYYYDEIPEGCNPHTWSSHGTWTACDYYPDHRNGSCGWSKPRELTSYQGNGYEIIYYFCPPSSGVCTPEGTLYGWQHSSKHNAMILNLSQWSSRQWNAIGVGMYNGVACIWFGEEYDPAGSYVIH